MANNYSTVTFLTLIPTDAIKPIHLLLLGRLGYECESYDRGSIKPMTYIYSTEPNSEIELDEDDEEALTEADKESPLFEAAFDGPDEITVETVVQDLLSGIAEAELLHVDVMASYVCDKARPGEHGGWSMRISRDGIKCQATHEIFAEWDREASHVLDLATMCEALSGHPDVATAQAVARISDYIGNHPAVECGDDEAARSPVVAFLAALKEAFPKFGERLDHPQLRPILNGWTGEVDGGVNRIELECVVGAATVPLTLLGDLGLTGQLLPFHAWMAESYIKFFGPKPE